MDGGGRQAAPRWSRRAFVVGLSGVLGWRLALPSTGQAVPRPGRRVSRIAFHGSGALCELDLHANTVALRRSDGRRAWRVGGPGRGPGRFDQPAAAAFDDEARVFVLDHGNSRVQILAADGALVAAFAGFGTGAGDLRKPIGDLVIHRARVYVADPMNSRVQVYALDGTHVRSLYPDIALADGFFPTALAMDTAGQLHAGDAGSGRIHVWDARGEPSRVYPEQAAFTYPASMVLVDDTTLVADSGAGTLHRVSQAGGRAQSRRAVAPDGTPLLPFELATHPGGTILLLAQPDLQGRVPS